MSRSWQDARLVVGVGLILASGFGVAAVVNMADQRVQVWSAARDLSPGTVLSAEDVVPVAFAGPDPATYLLVSDGLPTGVLTRPVGAGEVVAAGGLGARVQPASRLVTIEVDARRVPQDLGSGDRVDVWFTPVEAGPGSAQLVVEGVPVVGEVVFDELGGERQPVSLEVGPQDVARLVTASRAGALDLVRVPFQEVVG